MSHRLNLLFFIAIVALCSCSAAKKIQTHTPLQISSLKFLDEYVISHHQKFASTWIGGLSGIDYDRSNNKYFIISDERSATSPSRFYTANIKLNKYKIDTVIFVAVDTLTQPNGNPFPSPELDPPHAADPESIRYNPIKKNLIWSSEGDRSRRNGVQITENPSVFEMELNGRYIDSFCLPTNMHTQSAEAGPRNNGVFEGTTFDDNYKHLFVSVEEPIYEDGPRASVDYKGAPIRINKFDMQTRKPVAQYGYMLDAVAQSPKPADAFSINGVPEILWIGNNRLLVMERSFSTGNLNCTIKVFLANLKNATNVLDIHSLYKNKNYKPVTKRLLLNMNELNLYIDNVEGITLGPILPNGHQSLIFIADNNFNPLEQSQVFLFEVMP
jgi:hypothetical protein